MTVFLILLAVAVGLGWWVRHRSARLRREAESREAQVLEALFAARRSAAGNGGETIDLDKVFGGEAAPSESATSTDAVLRAAGLEAELIALVKSPPKQRTELAGGTTGAAVPAPQATAVQSSAVAPVPADEEHDSKAAPPRTSADADEPVLVRDLVQIFYEARGYRPVPAGRAARPIELVLRHKTDPLRSYAFAPTVEPVSEASARAMLERARGIDQTRVLLATEAAVAPELANALLTDGVRVFDSATIEAQLARLDFATAAKIRAVARRRAARRAQAALG
jgi:hypothetical protein